MSNTISYTQYFDSHEALQAFLNKINDATSATATEEAPAKKPAKKTAKVVEEEEPAPKTKKVSREDMALALTRLKDKKGVPAAKAVIKEIGGVAKMDDIPDDKIKAVFLAAEEALNASDEEDEDESM